MATQGLSDELSARVAALKPWFHSHDLGGGRVIERDSVYGADSTYPRVLWQRIAPLIPASLAGMSVLDIGCNSGFCSVQMKTMGAARVVGVEAFPLYLEQAKLVREILGLELELHCKSVYEVLPELGSFDLTLFLGVLYHLRHPLLGLERLAAVTRGTLVVESAIIPPAAPPESFRQRLGPRLGMMPPPRQLPDYAGEPHEVLFLDNDDPTNPAGEGLHNWFIPSMGALVAMVKAVGFSEILSAEAHVDRGVVVAQRR